MPEIAMKTIIEAIYENGLFRPVEKVELTEGTHVELRFRQSVDQRDPKAVAAKLSQLAAKAPRRSKKEAAGRNHDEIRYGGKSQP
jgi:predicted DNA-binding antitoxin AbrB/MazE fold protein